MKNHRTTDPDTSKEAAEEITKPGGKMKPSQKDVLQVMSRIGDCTQRTLEVHPHLSTKYSPSRIRSAVSELRHQGKVWDTGSRVRLASGRRAIVWRGRNELPLL